MKRQICAVVLAGSMLLSGTAFPQQSGKPLTNADVASMVKAGLADDVIVSSIRVSGGTFDVSPEGLIALNKAGVTMRVMEAMIGSAIPRTQDPPPTSQGAATGATPGTVVAQNLPPAALPGVPAPLSGPQATFATTPPAYGGYGGVANGFVGSANPQNGAQMGQMPGQFPVQYPGQMQSMFGAFSGMEPQPMVNLVAGGSNNPLFAERLQSIQVVSKGISSGNIGGGMALNQMMSAGATDVSNRMLNANANGAASAAAGINVVGELLTRKSAVSTYIWALRGRLSSSAIPSRRPEFDVSFADLPGVDPDQFEPRIVRLESTKNNFRLIGATKVTDKSGANNGAFGIVYSSFAEHEIDSEKKATIPGHVHIMPAKDLTAGEYAVVLRSVSAKKTFSGDTVSRNDGEGILFNNAWSFSVK